MIIFRYSIIHNEKSFSLTLPRESEILGIHEYYMDSELFILMGNGKEENRSFYIFKTGEYFEYDNQDLKYIGSGLIGGTMHHIFEIIKKGGKNE